jgi:hypothetical protein
MKFAEATNLNRKSGVAKWRDLLCDAVKIKVRKGATLQSG